MRLIYCLLCVVLLTGCTSNFTVEEQHKRTHIIDACYTVLETNPQDKDDKISAYLDSHKKDGDLSAKEAFIIQGCLKRTEESKKWKANKSFWQSL